MAFTLDGKYKVPDGLAVDLCIFTVNKKPHPDPSHSKPLYDLQILLVQRDKDSDAYPSQWAFPGGFSLENETFEETALRELYEETHLSGVHIEQLGAYNRTKQQDPRGWIPTIVHIALVPEEQFHTLQAGDDADDVRLFSVKDILNSNLAFDHNIILKDALERLRRKVTTTTTVKELLPPEFTFSELLDTIQCIVPEFKVAGSNFINKLTGTAKRKGIIELVLDESGNPKKTNRNSNAYAKLYRFSKASPKVTIYI